MAAVGPCYSSDSCARSHTAKFCKFASELQIHERLTRRQGALTIETVSLSCLRTRQFASRVDWNHSESNLGVWLTPRSIKPPSQGIYPFPQKFPLKCLVSATASPPSTPGSSPEKVENLSRFMPLLSLSRINGNNGIWGEIEFLKTLGSLGEEIIIWIEIWIWVARSAYLGPHFAILHRAP